MIEVTLLGTGSPIVDPNRAGPVNVGAGRRSDVPGRLRTRRVDAGCGGGRRRRQHLRIAADPSAQRPHHRPLRCDHDAMGHHLHPHSTTRSSVHREPRRSSTRRWTRSPPTSAIGSPIIADITEPPTVEVEEVTEGVVWAGDGVRITGAPTDHRPVEPTIGFRIEFGGASVVLGRRHRAVREPGRSGGRRGGAGAHRDPQGPRRTDACAADPRHPRLPLVGRAGGGHRRTGRRGHPHPHPLRAGHRAGPGGRLACAGGHDRSTGRSNWATTCTGSRCTPACVDLAVRANPAG